MDEMDVMSYSLPTFHQELGFEHTFNSALGAVSGLHPRQYRPYRT